MTDKDIIKALECCGIKTDCKGCYFDTHESEDICAREIVKNAFDLINHQKEEIEFLRKTIDKNAKRALDVTLEEIEKSRVEAIKEFANKLKKRSRKMQSSDFSGDFWDAAVLVEDIDNLVKEMAGNAE